MGRFGQVFVAVPAAALVAGRCPETLLPAGEQQSAAHQKQVAQGAECEHLRGVLLDSPISHLGVTELQFDHRKHMLDSQT